MRQSTELLTEKPLISRPSGYNELRWNCEKKGCFNMKCRPKIQMFAECFPGRINFGDVDGIVEMGGYFCMLEWKGAGGTLGTGQRLTFQQFTKAKGNIVFVADGNAETMIVTGWSEFWAGKSRGNNVGNLDGLKDRLRCWVHWVKQQEQRP